MVTHDDWIDSVDGVESLDDAGDSLYHLDLFVRLPNESYESKRISRVKGLTPRSPILPCSSENAPMCSTSFFRHMSQSALSASAAEREMACVDERDGTRYDKTGKRWVGWNLNHSS